MNLLVNIYVNMLLLLYQKKPFPAIRGWKISPRMTNQEKLFRSCLKPGRYKIIDLKQDTFLRVEIHHLRGGIEANEVGHKEKDSNGDQSPVFKSVGESPDLKSIQKKKDCHQNDHGKKGMIVKCLFKIQAKQCEKGSGHAAAGTGNAKKQFKGTLIK